MKRRDLLKAAPLAAAGFSCSGSNENPVGEAAAFDAVETKNGIAVAKTAKIIPGVAPDYGKYDLVIVDADGWVIEMNCFRDRPKEGIKCYLGRMRYKIGSKIYTGDDSGCIVDYETQTVSITCKDARLNRFLLYHLRFGEGGAMKGHYVYFTTPRKNYFNKTSAQLFKSDIPGYKMKPPTSKIAVPEISENKGPAVHPKLGID